MSDKITTPPPGENAENQNQVAIIQNSEVAIMPDLGSMVSSATQFGDLQKMEAGKVNLKTSYLKFEIEGEAVRRVYLGLTKQMSIDPVTQEEKGLVDAAILFDPSSGNVQIAMQTVLVGVLVELGNNTPVEITYIGKEQSKKGLFFQNFDVRKLG